MKCLSALIVALGFLASTTIAQVNPMNQGATVWFYRPADSPLPQDIPTLFEVGGLTRSLGRLAPGEYFGYSVSPGVHDFSYTRAPAKGQSVSLLVKAGEQAYVEVEFRGLKPVAAGEGAAALRRLRPMPDVHVLDRSVILVPGNPAPPVPASAASQVGARATAPVAQTQSAPVIVPVPANAVGPTIITWSTVASATSKPPSSPAAASTPATATASTPASPATALQSTLQKASTPSITISSPATVMGPLPVAPSAAPASPAREVAPAASASRLPAAPVANSPVTNTPPASAPASASTPAPPRSSGPPASSSASTTTSKPAATTPSSTVSKPSTAPGMPPVSSSSST